MEDTASRGGASRPVPGEFAGPSASAHWRSDSDSESDAGSDEGAGARRFDDDPLFSAEADDEDEKWVLEKRGGRRSDAILSCPCCLEIITIDCQKHAARDDQWRAMFVRNVRVDESVAFRPASSERNGAAKKTENAPDLEESDGPVLSRAVRHVRHAGGRAGHRRGVPLLQRVPHERLASESRRVIREKNPTRTGEGIVPRGEKTKQPQTKRARSVTVSQVYSVVVFVYSNAGSRVA